MKNGGIKKLGVDRLLREISLLKAERVILRKLSGHNRGDFFRLVQLAFTTDHVIRLGRILDRDERASSIWALLRWHPPVEQALRRRGLPVEDVRSFSRRVAVLRNSIFAHTAISALGAQDALYKTANVKTKEIDRFAAALSGAIGDVYRSLFDADPPQLHEYYGHDFDKIYAERA